VTARALAAAGAIAAASSCADLPDLGRTEGDTSACASEEEGIRP
jgi:hypothetical protein